jgi:hypothetical protein
MKERWWNAWATAKRATSKIQIHLAKMDGNNLKSEVMWLRGLAFGVKTLISVIRKGVGGFKVVSTLGN